MKALLVALALVLGLTLGAPPLRAEPDWVVLVRHAEKASTPADDPGLSEAGQRRAEALAALLAGAGVTHILTSDRRRTQDTAAPLARRLGLQPQALATRGGDHLAALVAAVQAQRGGTVLVVGHSNTVPALLSALGGPSGIVICESQHAQMWVLRRGDTRALRLQVGEPDVLPSAGCP